MPRRHRGWFLGALALAVAVVIGGGAYAFAGYLHTAGPDGAVRGYFAALQRGDEASALGFGTLPQSPSRRYLSAAVLREQHRLAPMSDVRIMRTDRNGDTATVHVQYAVDVDGTRATVTDAVGVHKQGGSWRLDRVAVPVQIAMSGADDRATILGAPLPTGPMLFFPGALPIRFDTPDLQTDPATVVVHMQQPDEQTKVSVVASPLGRRAMDAAVTDALASCLRGGRGADPLCPLPDVRAVPGSLQATLPSNISKSIGITVTGDLNGVFFASGTVPVVGRYAKLDFNNVASTVRGRIKLSFSAYAYAYAVNGKLTFYWRAYS